VAVISAVCSAADPEHAAAQLARAFSPVPASLTQPEQLRGIVRRYIGSINDRDRDRFVALFAPDGIREDPAGTHIGPDSIGKSWDQMHLHDRPFQIRVHNIVVVRQEAALYWSIEHQHEDGGSALARGVEIIGVEDNGQIASARSYWSRDAAAGSRTRSIAEATVAALNAKDCAAYADLWAEDGMWQAPLSPMPTIGIDNVRVSCEAMMSSTPNFSVQVDAVCASGAEAALAWTTVLRGRQRERIVSGVDIIALDNDGKIAALHSYWEPDGSP
jgi:ketosteroid isomerase-like protein